MRIAGHAPFLNADDEQEQQELNRKPVVIIDDAQDLAATALTAIKSMVNFHDPITFVLAGQPD